MMKISSFVLCAALFIRTDGFAEPSQTVMGKIALRSVETSSDAVIITREGREVFRYFSNSEIPESIETQSMTKSFVSLAIGFLMDEGKIHSLDQPLSFWFPEWANSPKSKITLGHVLTHTSGLEANRTTDDIYPQKDFVKYALEASLKDPPGSVFFYNNRAINLLPGLVKKISGLAIDQYLKKKLFTPLGIQSVEWRKDEAGNPQGMAGLRMSTSDFVKVGQFLLNDGVWNHQQLLSKKWLQISTGPSSLAYSGITPECALLWWLKYKDWQTVVTDQQLQQFEAAGVDADLMRALRESQKNPDFRFNQLWSQRKDLQTSLEHFDRLWKAHQVPYPKQVPIGTPYAFEAEGSGGQQIVILREKGVVGVRQRVNRTLADETNAQYQFQDFSQLLNTL